MRRKVLMVFGMCILFAVSLMGRVLPENAVRVFSTGQVELLAGSLADKVIYIQLNERSDVSGPECLKKLSAFLTANKPLDFKVLHQSTQGETGFIIGKLTAAPGIYRIHCLFRAEGDVCKINQIRIDIFHE